MTWQGGIQRFLPVVGSESGVLLFGGRLAGAGLLFLANLFLARKLGAAEFGRYSLSVSLLLFGSLFFDFGYFSSGAHLLTKERAGPRARGILGAMTAAALATSGLFVLGVLGLSRVADEAFAAGIGPILGSAAPLAPALIFPLVTEQAFKGLGSTGLLAASTFAPRALFVATVAGLAATDRLTAHTATLAFLGTGLVVSLGTLVLAGVRPVGWMAHVRELWTARQKFGRALYGGRLANLVSYRTDAPLLGHFWGATQVGQYNLAMSVAGLVAMFSQSVAASAFRGLAGERRIPGELHRRNLRGLVLVGTATLGMGYAVINGYLGSAYAHAANLLLPCVAAVALQGAYQPYNSWLLANAFGVELGRFLFVAGAVNVVGNVVLIPLGGAGGAAGASIVGMGVYLFLARRTYRNLSSPRPEGTT